MRPTSRGFTLIELMITVTVISIIAAIAVPMYGDYVKRGKITEATATLSDLRIRAERWFADNRSYVPGAGALDWRVVTGTKFFNYDCNTPAITANTFTCTASGVAGEGMGGFTYTINQSNVKTSAIAGHSGWTTACATRWISKKGEAC